MNLKELSGLEKKQYEGLKSYPQVDKATGYNQCLSDLSKLCIDQESIERTIRRAKSDYANNAKEFWNESGEEYTIAQAILKALPEMVKEAK